MNVINLTDASSSPNIDTSTSLDQLHDELFPELRYGDRWVVVCDENDRCRKAVIEKLLLTAMMLHQGG